MHASYEYGSVGDIHCAGFALMKTAGFAITIESSLLHGNATPWSLICLSPQRITLLRRHLAGKLPILRIGAISSRHF
jgi:hypothetical protein